MSTGSELEPNLQNVLSKHRTVINTVSIAPDHLNQLVSGSDDGSIIFWNLDNGEDATKTGLCFKLDGHRGAVTSTDYSSDGTFFVSASKDTTVKLWKLDSHSLKPNQEPITNKCHGSNIQSVHLNSTNEQFCTASDDKTVKIWSARFKNKFIQTLVGHNNWVRCAKYSPRNKDIIASCGDDCQLLVHDLRCGPRSLPMCKISGCKKSPSVSRINPGTTNGTTGTGLGFSSTHFTCLDWYPVTDTMIAVGSSDSSVRLYDIRNCQIVQGYESHFQPVTSLSFHSSGKYLVSSSLDSLIKIYDLLEGRVLFTIEAHTGALRCIRFNQSGDKFYSAGNDKVINVWQSNLLDTPCTFGIGETIRLSNFDTFDTMMTEPKTVVSGDSGRHNHAMIEPDSRMEGASTLRRSRTLSDTRKSSSEDERLYTSRNRSKGSKYHDVISVSDEEVTYDDAAGDGWDSRQTRDSGRSTDDRRRRVDSTSSTRSSIRSRIGSDLATSRPASANDRYFPEHKLLRGIVDQIGNLTDAVAMIERRLATVEERINL